MPRLTTVYATIRIERSGPSGPDNERRIEKLLEALPAMQERDKHTELHVEAHAFETTHETVD
jgi:hypothetical protein